MGRAFILYLIHRYEEAIECASQAIEMESTAERARLILAVAQAEGGHPRQAVETCEDLARRFPDSRGVPGALAYALARSGSVERARGILRAAARSGAEPLGLAMAWTALGDLDHAFRCLGKADWDTTNVDLLVLSAAFDPLRSDPRYRSLRASLGL
ncbi:MAG: tetratricopeptide repeat protein [Gemmatimonadota bacterium]